MEMHYLMIIMQAMVVKMLWDGYMIIFFLCCCSFICVLVVLEWWVMSYSLGYFQWLCMDILCMYKTNTVKLSYSGEGYSEGISGDSDGAYSRDGYDGATYSAGDSLDSGGYTSDDIWWMYSGGYSRVYDGCYAIGYAVSSGGYDTSLYKAYRRGYGKRVYVNQVYDKRLLWTRYKSGIKGAKGNQMIKRWWVYKKRW